MTPNLPLPQRAATLASQFFRAEGHSLPLNIIQEAIARSRGHKSFQECVAQAETPSHANEGLELWCITGREYGDDDDSASHLWAVDEDEATDRFIRETLGLTPDEDDSPAEGHSRYFIVSTTCLGVMRNGTLELSPWLNP